MTNAEITNKAKETSGGNYYYEQGFIYGFELGEENGRKELEKENAEFKQKLESDELALNEANEIIAELKMKLLTLENKEQVVTTTVSN